MELRREGTEIFGREPELALLVEFLGSPWGDRTAIVTGSPGIGKTTLLQSAIDAARDAGAVVLIARASEAEQHYSLAALADLLAGVGEQHYARLPVPQRRALEVALLRSEPGADGVDPRAVGAGLRSILEGLARQRSVIAAVDDVQWLDRESAAALEFARRRLRDHDVTCLFSQRTGTTSALTRPSDGLTLELAPLSFGALRRVLTERLDLTVGRRTVRRIRDATGGNPLFALEIGRALVESGLADDADDVPVPSDVEAVLGVRVARLPKEVRAVLLAVALGGDRLAADQLEAVADAQAVAEAERSGVLTMSAGLVRPAHPLYAEAARTRATEADRQAMHLVLADLVEDESQRLRHRALAAPACDEALAEALSLGSADAARRGAAVMAAELASHALRLTPESEPTRPERLLALCERLMVAGEPEQATRLLAREIDLLPPGPTRARAHLMLGEGRGSPPSFDGFREHLERALEESRADAALHANVIGWMSRHLATAVIERIPEAEAAALNALPAARKAGPEVEREVLHGLAWARVLRGAEIDELCERFNTLSDSSFEIYRSLDRVVGERHAYRGELIYARQIVDALIPLADERGEDWSLTWLRMSSCELWLRAGDWNAAAEFLADWDPAFETAERLDSVRLRYLALLAAGRGDVEVAHAYAQQALADGTAGTSRWHIFEVTRAQATAALASGKPDEAAGLLGPAWEHLEREGVTDPGVFPIAPDLVEALASTHRLVEAARVTDALDRRAVQLGHPWGKAAVKRCRGTVRFAENGDATVAEEELEQAAREFAELGLLFDRARSILALGRAQRRLRRWAAARRALSEAVAAFEDQGATGWAAVARQELDRVGGRKPADDGILTPSERSVVELAQTGLSNKEIAARLVVSVHTVEVHLSHAYRKLGVRSRTQLARLEDNLKV